MEKEVIVFSRKWDIRFLEMAKNIATWSNDRSTKVGCVVVGPDKAIRSTGVNGFPSGVDDENEEWHKRPNKYFVTEHSERNACYSAALRGTALYGSTMYVTSAPCADCARAIIACGIKRVVLPKIIDPANAPKGDWETSVSWGLVLFKAKDIIVDVVDMGAP